LKKVVWGIWLIATISLASYYGYKMFQSENKEALLIGDTSHGHFQIELACSSCHTSPFGGPEVIQDACTNCHAEELEESHDSHPKKKFTDPRNADLLEVIDARYCVSCHTEHKKEQTHSMGLTLPKDYCFHCHQDVGEERESHKDLAFDSCASSGCHNYHDNRALYEDFLVENHQGPWLKEIAQITEANAAAKLSAVFIPTSQPGFEEKKTQHPDTHHAWATSIHAAANVDCAGCHSNSKQQWIEAPGIEQCQTCHNAEVETFTQGKHGMKLALGMTAISPSDSLMPFKNQSLAQHQSCSSCHDAHKPDRLFAAKDACLNCHNDEHSLAFDSSPHGQLFSKAIDGMIPAEETVSCATCHMPREKNLVNGKKVISVNHNQNYILRPNEKMIRPVCLQCHNLEFSIDALADEALIKSNFNGKPSIHVQSIDWAIKRIEE